MSKYKVIKSNGKKCFINTPPINILNENYNNKAYNYIKYLYI